MGKQIKTDKRLDRRAVAKGAGFAAALSLLQGSATAAGATTEGTPEPTLYERVGGIFTISAVVNRFSDEIITNPKLNVNPALKAWNETEAETRLPGLKFLRTLWIASAAGGPFEYTGLPLDEAHTRFKLTSEDFDEVGAEIVRALEFYKVPEAEITLLVEAYMTAKPDVVGDE